MEPITLSFLWLFTAAAAYFDLRYRKVPNWLILCALSGGAVISASGGWSSLRYSLLGFLVGMLLLLPAFVLHMVGGGDVKALAVIGLFVGPRLLWHSFLLGAAAAGTFALFILAVRYLPMTIHPSWSRGHSLIQKAGAWTLPYAGILSLCSAFYVSLS